MQSGKLRIVGTVMNHHEFKVYYNFLRTTDWESIKKIEIRQFFGRLPPSNAGSLFFLTSTFETGGVIFRPYTYSSLSSALTYETIVRKRSA